jgi:hypothetical protein
MRQWSVISYKQVLKGMMRAEDTQILYHCDEIF